MNVTYACPACGEGTRSQFDADTTHLKCNACGQELAVPEDAVEGDRVQRCLVCPSTDLFVRKDFPQRLGVLIVAVGIIGSSVAWYHAQLFWTFGILFATAARRRVALHAGRRRAHVLPLSGPVSRRGGNGLRTACSIWKLTNATVS